ncbi:hypothetical protein [Caballeronia glebae]|nr:hypothetical protein [Caballeronia glebae]
MRAAGIAPVTRTRGKRDMHFPWLPLVFILGLLGFTLFVCRTLNASERSLKWNGALIFLFLCFAAMLLDFTLTMIFASAGFNARTPYDSFGSRIAWSERVVTYLIPGAISLFLALRFRRRQRFARALSHDGAPAEREGTLQIQTSPYTRSELTL